MSWKGDAVGQEISMMGDTVLQKEKQRQLFISKEDQHVQQSKTPGDIFLKIL